MTNRKSIENAILEFDNWNNPDTFYESVCASLQDENLKLFQEIWKRADDAEHWKHLDIVLGCKATHNFIRNNYDLDEHIIGTIVRAVSYKWN